MLDRRKGNRLVQSCLGRKEERDDFLYEKDTHPENAEDNADPARLDDQAGDPVSQ